MSNKIQSAFDRRKAAQEKEVKPVTTEKSPEQEAFENRFTLEQIAKWKKQFGDRQLIALGVDGKWAALRPPTSEDLSDYTMALINSDMSKAVLLVMEKLWLDGDIDLIENEDYFMAVFLQMHTVLEARKATLFRL